MRSIWRVGKVLLEDASHSQFSDVYEHGSSGMASPQLPHKY